MRQYGLHMRNHQRQSEEGGDRILLGLQTETRHGREVARGVIAYTHEHAGWRLGMLRSLDPHDVLTIPGRGVIAHASVPEHYQTFRRAGLLHVTVGPPCEHGPAVGVDEAAVADLAAEHLIDLGLKQFAFVGHRDWPIADHRRAQFDAALTRRGFAPARFFTGRLFGRRQRASFERRIDPWLSRLPTPTGILGVGDLLGFEVITAASRIGRHVPDELAVIGIDNDDLLGQLADVPLTSIDQSSFTIGYEAARMMDHLLDNPTRRPADIQLPPAGVIPRASTDRVASRDSQVAAALGLIRDHAHEPIDVAWVVRQLPIARRTLERRFKQHVGRTVLEQIHKMRFERACAMLAETDAPLEAVARQTGFANARWLADSFRRSMRITPTAYRARFRST